MSEMQMKVESLKVEAFATQMKARGGHCLGCNMYSRRKDIQQRACEKIMVYDPDSLKKGFSPSPRASIMKLPDTEKLKMTSADRPRNSKKTRTNTQHGKLKRWALRWILNCVNSYPGGRIRTA